MNTLAGSITFNGSIELENFSLNYVLNKTKNGVSNIFVYGDTELESSKEVVECIRGKIIGEILCFDISISTEDKIKLFTTAKKLKYILKSIQGDNIDFDNVLAGLNEPNIISVREAEDSKIFGNKVIKIDYLV
ncbi:MAG: hypothetical protein PHZ26_01910 [Candidatus Gracilibacteria bacterium]|nr:hypothetical protein [Candidatus Gracilibacteria bacterium]MDD2908490.1 hypothetical protein [Candidatus Gracilibacteria bacterium]